MLNRVQLFIWRCRRNFFKNLKYPFVPVLKLEYLQRYETILVCVLDHLLGCLNFIETSNELVGERVDPISELLAHLHERVADLGFPGGD